MKKAGKGLYIVFLIVIFAILGQINPACALQIVYPQNNATINASSTFFVGNTQSDAILRINDQRVKVYPNGGFVQVVPLKPGVNQITITSAAGKSKKSLTYTITTPEPQKAIAKFPLQVIQSSVQPSNSIVYSPGDALQISFKGSSDCKAYFSIGKKKLNIPMIEQKIGISGSKSIGNGIYKGIYKIQDDDIFNQESITIQLLSDGKNYTYTIPSTISTIPPSYPLIIASVKNDGAVVRTAPDKTRLTPLPEGTILHLTAKVGKNYRYKMNDSMSGWIAEEDVNVLPEGSPYSSSLINSINVESDEKSVYFSIPLSQKQPIMIEQPSENEVYLKIYNAQSTATPFNYKNRDGFLKTANIAQESPGTVKISLKTNAKQLWGYKYRYAGDSLVLELRKPPTIDPDKPLKDIVICLDPGHGGKELGAIGPTNTPEKMINLNIALKLKSILESSGAKVLMTREGDEDTELYSRVKYAALNDAQLLISIHNNSLPDGKNPYTEHGTSTFYYQPQSLPMAKVLHQALLEDVGFRDNGLFWNSFVLTRPTEMPAVLLELGFMINPDEYTMLVQSAFQDKIAASIARGLTYYMFSNSPSALNNKK